MLSILLVEDEKLELETLRDYVDWKKLGMDRVYTARNGRRALECMAEHEPDIVITDIQMPVMDGIELTRRIREEGYSCKIIFLTGYDDFSYVKAAFSVDAVDYILKPFGVEEVEELIGRVRGQLMKEKMTENSLKLAAGRLLEQVCAAYMDERSLDDLSELHFGKKASEAAFGLLGIYGNYDNEDMDTFSAQPEVLHLFEKKPFAVVILRGHIRARDAAVRAGQLVGKKACVVWSENRIPLSGLKGKLDHLERLSNTLFHRNPGETVCLEKAECLPEEEPDGRSLHELRVRLRSAVTTGDEGEAQAALSCCLEELSACAGEICGREAFRIYWGLNNRLVLEDEQLREYMKEEAISESALMNAAFFVQISEKLTRYVQRLCSFFKKQKEDPNYYVIAWVKEYVVKNYAGVCSAEEMAEGLHLSPNYLRSLFKTGTGQTVLEYLTDYRLEKACELLKDKTRKVREISGMTGYENVSWFNQLFLKKYGVTPNEYRKMV